MFVSSLMRDRQLQRRQLQLVCAPICSVQRICSLFKPPYLPVNCGIVNSIEKTL